MSDACRDRFAGIVAAIVPAVDPRTRFELARPGADLAALQSGSRVFRLGEQRDVERSRMNTSGLRLYRGDTSIDVRYDAPAAADIERTRRTIGSDIRQIMQALSLPSGWYDVAQHVVIGDRAATQSPVFGAGGVRVAVLVQIPFLFDFYA